MKIQDKDMLATVREIAPKIASKNRNLRNDDVATFIVRAMLLKFGMTEELKDEYVKERTEAVSMISPWITAAKNSQSVLLADPENSVDGKTLLMPKAEKVAKMASAEFV